MDEPSEEEIVAVIVTSLKEVHMTDNGDETVTMTCILEMAGDRHESTGVFQANLGEWFGLAIAAGIKNMTADLEEILNTGVMVPNSLDET